MTLYELTADYAELVAQYDSAETPEEREECLAKLIDAEGAISDKAENYARLIKIKEAEAKAFGDESNRLDGKKKAAEAMVKRLKSALLDTMKLTGTNVIPTSIGKWRLQNNPWSCDVVDESKVPVQYLIPQPAKVDRKAILKWFALTGEVVDGVEFKQEQGIRFG